MPQRYRAAGTGKVLDPKVDISPWSEWNSGAVTTGATRHPDGFLVFLLPEDIARFDEYAGADPYSVENNLESPFHRARIEVTCELVHQAAARASGGARVLDVGAGEGHITVHFADIPGVSEVVGLDSSVTAVQKGTALHPNLELIVGDAYDIPFVGGFFDIVVLNNIWEHVPDPMRMLAEMKRVCQPGGFVIISTPSRFRTANLARVVRGRKVTFMSGQHVTEYTVGQVKEQLRYGGFDVERVASRPINLGSRKGDALAHVLRAATKTVKSHHVLDPTVFYLARNVRAAGTAYWA